MGLCLPKMLRWWKEEVDHLFSILLGYELAPREEKRAAENKKESDEAEQFLNLLHNYGTYIKQLHLYCVYLS